MKKGNSTISSIFKGNTPISKIMKGSIKVYEAWQTLIMNAIPPFTIKSKGDDLIDYKINGNVGGVGDRTSNLYDFFDTSQLEKLNYTATTQRWCYNLGVLPAGSYTISFELVDDSNIPASVYIRQKTAEDTFSNAIILTTTEVRNNPATFTADGSSEYYFMFASGSVSTMTQAIERIEMFKWIKFELGNKATGPEPYGYKIPIQVTSTIYEFKLENVDYYPIDSTKSRYGFDLGVLEAGDYTIDVEFKDKSNIIEYLYVRYWKGDEYSSYIYVTATADKAPVSFTADGESHYYLYFANGILSSLEAVEAEWQKVKGAYLQKSSTFERYETTIYLNEPLMKGASISYKENNLPAISTYKDLNIIEVNTSVLPNTMEVTYKGKKYGTPMLDAESNMVLNDILAVHTNTYLNIPNDEINQILDNIIGGQSNG